MTAHDAPSASLSPSWLCPRNSFGGRNGSIVRSAALAVAVAATSVANADVIYSNLSSEGSYQSSAGLLVGGPTFNVAQAAEFVNGAPADVALNQIDLAFTPSRGDGDAIVSLWSASGDALGSELAHWSVAVPSDPANSLATLSHIDGVSLHAGSAYFLQVSSADAASLFTWNLNDVGATAQMIASSPNGGSISSLGMAPAFQLQGSVIATPLPGTAWLTLSGLSLLLALLSRRNTNSFQT
jgi:hypothetical protein